jgi:hypothetical protein
MKISNKTVLYSFLFLFVNIYVYGYSNKSKSYAYNVPPFICMPAESLKLLTITSVPSKIIILNTNTSSGNMAADGEWKVQPGLLGGIILFYIKIGVLI